MKNLRFFSKEIQIRLFFTCISFFTCFFTFYFYSKEYIILCTKPIYTKNFIFTNISEAFQASIELSYIGTFFLLMPYIFYQIFCFIIPGLFESERKYFKKYISIFLFIWLFSILISWNILLPSLWKFFHHFEFSFLNFELQLEARILPSLQFIFRIFFLSEFLCFIPFGIYILLEKEIINRKLFTQNRNFFYFLLLLFCAGLSPTDLIIQMMVSMIGILIFEILVFFAYVQEFSKQE